MTIKESEAEQHIKPCFMIKMNILNELKAISKVAENEMTPNAGERNYQIWNEDCITGSRKIASGTVKLIICDSPFGLGETRFDNLYNRDKANVMTGYVEAPVNYDKFTLDWLTECKRILHDDGSMYIISGWTNLSSFYKAIAALGLFEVNHIVWKFNFGVNTKNKFVSSHYHIFYLTKSEKAGRNFNSNCRFTQLDKDANNRSMLYQDLEDVWVINKEFQPGEVKNVNKLPNKLVEKMIEYSSIEGDTVCDFFMGNFTTADCALRLGRKVTGFEINPVSYDHHIERMSQIEFGIDLAEKVEVENPFFNQGKKLSGEEKTRINKRFNELSQVYKTKKERVNVLTKEFGRGAFSINNIIKQVA